MSTSGTWNSSYICTLKRTNRSWQESCRPIKPFFLAWNCKQPFRCWQTQSPSNFSDDWLICRKLRSVFATGALRLTYCQVSYTWLVCSLDHKHKGKEMWFDFQLDCQQSLFFFRFSKGSARARERWAAKPRDARNKSSPVSRSQSRAWSFACLGRFARRTKKKERLLVV